MKPTKWIIFDVSGVLTHWTFRNPKGYEINGKHFDGKKIELLYESLEYKEYMTGRISYRKFLEAFFGNQNLDMTVGEFSAIFENDLRPIKGIHELIKKLSSNYKIALASNEGKELAEIRIKKSGVERYVSKKIISYQIGKLKPEKDFFIKTLEILGAKPYECLFIDDSPLNVEAAIAVGIKSLVFTDTSKLKQDLEKIDFQIMI